MLLFDMLILRCCAGLCSLLLFFFAFSYVFEWFILPCITFFSSFFTSCLVVSGRDFVLTLLTFLHGPIIASYFSGM